MHKQPISRFDRDRNDSYDACIRLDIVKNAEVSNAKLPFGQPVWPQSLSPPCFDCRFVRHLFL